MVVCDPTINREKKHDPVAVACSIHHGTMERDNKQKPREYRAKNKKRTSEKQKKVDSEVIPKFVCLSHFLYQNHVEAYALVQVLPCPTQKCFAQARDRKVTRCQILTSPNKNCNDDVEYFDTTTQQPTRNALSPKSDAGR
jgi:hypothetical protein